MSVERAMPSTSAHDSLNMLWYTTGYRGVTHGASAPLGRSCARETGVITRPGEVSAMPFVKKSGEHHTLSSTDTHKAFVGRASELHFFAEHLLIPKEPTSNILVISGQGGVGKSTLLARFIQLALAPDFADYCLVATVDERQVTPTNIMEQFANQLHMTGVFEKALIRYKEALRRLQSGRDPLRETILSTASDVAASTVDDVPIIGGILREGTKTTAEYLVQEHRTRQMLKDAERLENPIYDLTTAFVEELNRLADTQVTLSFNRGKRQRRVLLFFDTFEQLGIEIAPWLLEYFLQANISSSVVLVIAGRDAIERSTPGDPKRWLPYLDDGTISALSLNSFTEEETRTYLMTRGIIEPTRIATIWQLSHGLPLYLGLLTSHPQAAVDPTKDVVVNFLRWIPAQEQVKRRLALNASLFSRPFHQDDLEAFPYVAEQDRSAYYQWLTELPFVRSNPQDGRYTYHDLAQALFSRHLFQRSRKEYFATRQTLAEYYQRQLEATQAKRSEATYRTALQGRAVFYSAEWIELAMALAYQLFLLPDPASHERAIEQVLYAYEYTEHTEEITRVLRNLSQSHLHDQMQMDVQQSAHDLLRYIEGDSKPVDKWKRDLLVAADKLLKTIAQKASFPTTLLAHIYRKRGYAYTKIDNFDQALADYAQALELDPFYARAYASRGSVYRRLGNYEQAIEEYNSALQLAPKYAWVYFGRGTTYYHQHKYLLALEDLSHAIVLEPNYARAYEQRGLVHLWLKDIGQAKEDYLQSWELSTKYRDSVWMATWCLLCQERLQVELIQPLATIVATHPHLYIASLYRAIIAWQQRHYEAALQELERAIQLEQDRWDASFWKGMACASLGHDADAIATIEQALVLEMPPVLLAPLHWFAEERPDFYEKQALPLFARALKSQ
jgi:tetratricopeptide (TPR) repeat protein